MLKNLPVRNENESASSYIERVTSWAAQNDLRMPEKFFMGDEEYVDAALTNEQNWQDANPQLELAEPLPAPQSALYQQKVPPAKPAEQKKQAPAPQRWNPWKGWMKWPAIAGIVLFVAWLGFTVISGFVANRAEATPPRVIPVLATPTAIVVQPTASKPAAIVPTPTTVPTASPVITATKTVTATTAAKFTIAPDTAKPGTLIEVKYSGTGLKANSEITLDALWRQDSESGRILHSRSLKATASQDGKVEFSDEYRLASAYAGKSIFVILSTNQGTNNVTITIKK